MKNQYHARPDRVFSRFLILGLLSFVLGYQPLVAEVSFTQTLNADFNKGVLNNVNVGSDNVYLQFSASSVGNWLTTTVLPQTLTGHGAASWNDRFAYIVGGFNNLSYVNTVYYASISGSGISGWTALNPLPVALRDPAVVIGTNTIYVMGGRDGSQVYNTIYYAAINYDGTIGAWQTSAVNLPVALWGHTASYSMGYIYVIGGTSSMTENTALASVYYTKVNALNTLSAFSAGTSLSAARNKHSTVVYNRKLYVLGGYDNAGTKSNTVYIATPALNGSTGAWSSGTNLPVSVSNHSALVTNGMIAVMGGAVGATLSNTVYYSSADVLSWTASPNLLYDYLKDGAAFSGNGQIYYCGGVNPSATPLLNCRYANLTLTANYVSSGSFVSMPFYELGAERVLDSLVFAKIYAAPANLQVTYRTAGTDGIWGDWTALTATTKIVVGATKQYLQYAAVMTGSGTNNSTLQSMTLYTPGTQLTGDISATTTFTKALSPYWATGDIWFNSGTHTFQAGATILFLAGTGLTVNQANVICNGTVADSVKFMYYTNETGKWDGIYFTDNSDNGVSSQFYYTVIAGAGFGSNDANLYCLNSNEPLLNRCSIRWADGTGIRLETAHLSMQNTVVKSNNGNGIYLASSNPSLNTCSISYNALAGVYYSSTASVPNFSSGTTTINNNTYALRHPSPDQTFYQPNGNPVLTNNTYNGICINAGDIASNQRWNTVTYDYILLGTVRLAQYAGAARLTIEPGNTIKSLSGVQIQVGVDGSYGGEIYAIGTPDSVITFTSHNGLAGGWNGIYFTNWSDNWGGQTQMDYCIIEKGNDYNYFSENTSQPNLINHTIIRNAVTDGARYSNAAGSITNCQFLTNGRYPLYFMNPEANPVHSGNTYTGNTTNFITLSGGTYSFDRTYNYDGVGYYVLSSIIMGSYGSTCRLTLHPSVTFAFAPGTKLQLGYSGSYGGEIYAVGTSTNRITFRAFNTTAGGWEGIHFTTFNDNWGGVSTLEYCNIRYGNAQNILIEGSSQPTMNYCNVHLAATNGIVLYQSNPSITNCAIYSNGSYPLKFNDWTCDPYLKGNSYTTNGMNFIALSGGSYDNDRMLRFDNVPYHVLGDINMAQYSGHSRLTVQPGVTLNFDPGVGIQLGWSGSYGGDLWAEGKADSLITFKPYNNTVGGWDGIYFSDYNDNWSGTSSLKYCIVEKGATYNINCVSSTQPSMSNCILRNSGLHGMTLTSSSPSIQNCTFTQNAGYPLKFNNWQCNAYLKNNTYTSNTPNYIAMSGGDYDAGRTVYYDGAPYHVLGDINMALYANHARLTVQPGVSLFFDPGVGIMLGYPSNSYGGDLWAEGKADSLISFKPYNNLAGGWDGIYFTQNNDEWGGTSLLKYCVIEKGASYNVLATNSGQPTIESSILRQSNGSGLIVNGNSNLTIRNSDFIFNAMHGIYFDNTATATLGNADAYSCNLFNNTGYELYNNSTSNINARYNYWGTGDSTMVALRIFDKSDNTAKGRVYFMPFSGVPSLLTTNTLLSGSVKYANIAATPIANATMQVRDFTNTLIASTTTNASGNFTFPLFESGPYKLTIAPVSPTPPWYPCNATDALAILNHFAQIAPLSGMNYAAADVNVSHSINGTDAMFVLKRFNQLIPALPAGDYLWASDTVIVSGSNVTNHIQMLCFGDVNASFIPSKSAASVGLVHEGSVLVESFTEFEFPVRVKYSMEIGAISLGFYYPEQYLEVTGVRLANGNNGITWSAANGLFTMGWCETAPLNPGDDEVVVILSMKTKDLSSLTSPIALDLFEGSEFADASATPNGLSVVSIPFINTTITGTGPAIRRSGFSVFPNPARGQVTLSFTLDNNAHVRITLLDLPGTELKEVCADDYAAGESKVMLSTSEVKPGIYFLKFEQTSNGQSASELIKMVVSQ